MVSSQWFRFPNHSILMTVTLNNKFLIFVNSLLPFRFNLLSTGTMTFTIWQLVFLYSPSAWSANMNTIHLPLKILILKDSFWYVVKSNLFTEFQVNHFSHFIYINFSCFFYAFAKKVCHHFSLFTYLTVAIPFNSIYFDQHKVCRYTFILEISEYLSSVHLCLGNFFYLIIVEVLLLSLILRRRWRRRS